MLGTKDINKESTKDPAQKELKQLGEGGTSKEAGDWQWTLRDYHVKHAYYTMVDNSVLIDGRAVIPTGLRS